MIIHVTLEKEGKQDEEVFTSGLEVSQFKQENVSTVCLFGESYSETIDATAKFIELGLNDQINLVVLGFSEKFDQNGSLSWEMIRKVDQVVRIKSPNSEYNVVWGYSLEEFPDAISTENDSVGFFIN